MAGEQNSGQRRTALVTGASSGLGAIFAERLARDGYDLVVVARRREHLEDLAARLREDFGVAVEVLVADLANPADVRRVEARIAADNSLEMLVNNAGFAVYTRLLDSDPDEMDEMIRLNVVALMRLTRAALPGMLARDRGLIINVSSGLSFMPVATRATYSGTKAFVNNFTLAVHDEVRGTGVRVQVLLPGITRTEFHDRSGTDITRIPDSAIMAPEAVVDASLAGLRLGEVVCIPGLPDLEALAHFEEAQAALAPYFRTNQLAPRYLT